MRLIDLFEVAPEDDEVFVADWERGRLEASVLYRALRADVDFRFASVARLGAAELASHPSLYEVVHEEGAPDGSEGVTLVNPFEVPAGDDDRFLAGWERARAALADQRGYLAARRPRTCSDGDARGRSRWTTASTSPVTSTTSPATASATH